MASRTIPYRIILCGVTFLLGAALPCAEDRAPEIVVYKSPECGCCSKWADHLSAAGFSVTTREVDDVTAVKSRQDVDREVSSCHTAIVDGYTIEGHVPADVILRLLEEQPHVAGLAVPGMRLGSPGMEGPYEEPYEVLTFDADGNTEIFATR